MIDFKNFPAKELILRVLAITCVLLSFMFLEKLINRPQTQDFSVEIDETQEKNRCDAALVDQLVNKLNASITLQEHLLTIEYQDKDVFLTELNNIKEKLEDIEKRAQEQQVAKLINQSKINGIKEAIEIYRNTLQST